MTSPTVKTGQWVYDQSSDRIFLSIDGVQLYHKDDRKSTYKLFDPDTMIVLKPRPTWDHDSNKLEEGYQWIHPSEELRDGDEYRHYDTGEWVQSNPRNMIACEYFIFRRPVPPVAPAKEQAVITADSSISDKMIDELNEER